MSKKSYLFTSESVSEGHPDKVCDRISDTVVDAFLAADPEKLKGAQGSDVVLVDRASKRTVAFASVLKAESSVFLTTPRCVPMTWWANTNLYRARLFSRVDLSHWYCASTEAVGPVVDSPRALFAPTAVPHCLRAAKRIHNSHPSDFPR